MNITRKSGVKKEIQSKLARRQLMNLNLEENEFEALAHLTFNVHSNSFDVVSEDYEEKCRIKFLIDVDYKSWGIDGFSITIQPQEISVNANFDISRHEAPEKEEIKSINITFDPSRFRLEPSEFSHRVTVESINVTLDENFQVLYDESYIEITK